MHFGNPGKLFHPGLGSDTFREKGKCLNSGVWAEHGQWIVTNAAFGLISIPSMDRATENPEIMFLSGDSCSCTPEDLCLLRKYSSHGLQVCSSIAVVAEVWDENAYFHEGQPFLWALRQLLLPLLLLSLFNIHHAITGAKVQPRRFL